MKALIIEDEKPAAEKLIKALQNTGYSIEIKAIITSVKDATNWLKENGFPDIIFMDIELNDGSSFKLFKEMEVRCPIIFTTAYDEYWQEAFEHNGIDYLLKPVKEDKLKAALNKHDKLKEHFAANYKKLSEWTSASQTGKHKKKVFGEKGNRLCKHKNRRNSILLCCTQISLHGKH